MPMHTLSQYYYGHDILSVKTVDGLHCNFGDIYGIIIFIQVNYFKNINFLWIFSILFRNPWNIICKN